MRFEKPWERTSLSHAGKKPETIDPVLAVELFKRAFAA